MTYRELADIQRRSVQATAKWRSRMSYRFTIWYKRRQSSGWIRYADTVEEVRKEIAKGNVWSITEHVFTADHDYKSIFHKPESPMFAGLDNLPGKEVTPVKYYESINVCTGSISSAEYKTPEEARDRVDMSRKEDLALLEFTRDPNTRRIKKCRLLPIPAPPLKNGVYSAIYNGALFVRILQDGNWYQVTPNGNYEIIIKRDVGTVKPYAYLGKMEEAFPDKARVWDM